MMDDIWTDEIQGLGCELPELPEEFTLQRRQNHASNKSLQHHQMIGADTETLDGCADLFSYEVPVRKGKGKKAHFDYEGRVRTVATLWDVLMCGVDAGHKWTTGGRKGYTIPHHFFWNIKFDMQAVMKMMSQRAINELMIENKVEVNARTGDYLPKGGSEPMVKITYLQGKFVRFEPVDWTFHEGEVLCSDADMRGYPIGQIHWWDIAQFFSTGKGRMRLNTAAKEHLGEGKIEVLSDGSILDASLFGFEGYVGVPDETLAEYALEDEDGNKTYWTTPVWMDYYAYYAEDIKHYAIVDAELTGRLARIKSSEFTETKVRFIQPYSTASIAQRNLLDRGYFPTMNAMMRDDYEAGRSATRAFMAAYHGGVFDAQSTGYIEDISLVDLTSAYPYIMWNLPAISKQVENTPGKGKKSYWTEEQVGEWTCGEGAEGWEEAIEGKPYAWPGAVEVCFNFEAGMNWYPLVTKADNGCLLSSQFFTGWITLEEYREAVQWPQVYGHMTGRWVMYENDKPTYPFRDFIRYWYQVKDGAAKDSVERAVAKLCLNSIYGKLQQCIEGKTGTCWAPPMASTITGATRARMYEFCRLNNFDPVMFATDGIIIEKDKLVTIPPRPADAIGSLGEWEVEIEGDAVIVGSGVYSVLTKDSEGELDGYGKSTVRGNASMNFRGYKSWLDFCERNADATEHVTKFKAPISAGQAKQKVSTGQYEHINIFTDHTARLKPALDSSKRVWLGPRPKTFSELLVNRYELTPHITVDTVLPDDEYVWEDED